MTDPDSETKDRKQRKEEGKLKKRQRIEESGGIRPRGANNDEKTKKSRSSVDDATNAVTSPGKYSKDDTKQSTATATNNEDDDSSRPQQRERPAHQRERPLFGNYDNPNANATNRPGSMNHNNNRNSGGKSSYISRHRFGRVMETVPCRNKSRFSTVSIALPGSVLSNCQTRELRTLLVGQIARACTIYHVDEIIVFDDKLGKTGNSSGSGGGWRDFKRQKNRQDGGNNDEKQNIPTEKKVDDAKSDYDIRNNNNEQPRRVRSTHQEFMARLLQYCECPQYLRRQFFPMHPDLQFAGLLAPVDAPHHVREGDRSKYREGVVMNKNSSNGNSLVNCGIRNRPVEIDRNITPGIRCTVQIDPSAYGKAAQIKGIVVSPSAPREDDGTYWGYTTRMAKSINDVFAECPYADDGGYDLKIGTSERGSKSVEDKSFGLPKFQHSLIVFGGVAGIEECVDADESIKLAGSSSSKLFDLWLNTCPFQASRTIRTEEAVLISLAKMNPFLMKASHDKEIISQDQQKSHQEDDEFSDESLSDESGEEESDEGDDNDDDNDAEEDDGK